MNIQDALFFYCKDTNDAYGVGETYDSLEWMSDRPKPTEEELEQAYIDYLAYIERNKYKSKRAAEYPSIPDQLDIIYHSGIEAWKIEIKRIKDKYPKPI